MDDIVDIGGCLPTRSDARWATAISDSEGDSLITIDADYVCASVDVD